MNNVKTENKSNNLPLLIPKRRQSLSQTQTAQIKSLSIIRLPIFTTLRRQERSRRICSDRRPRP